MEIKWKEEKGVKLERQITNKKETSKGWKKTIMKEKIRKS